MLRSHKYIGKRSQPLCFSLDEFTHPTRPVGKKLAEHHAWAREGDVFL